MFSLTNFKKSDRFSFRSGKPLLRIQKDKEIIFTYTIRGCIKYFIQANALKMNNLTNPVVLCTPLNKVMN